MLLDEPCLSIDLSKNVQGVRLKKSHVAAIRIKSIPFLLNKMSIKCPKIPNVFHGEKTIPFWFLSSRHVIFETINMTTKFCTFFDPLIFVNSVYKKNLKSSSFRLSVVKVRHYFLNCLKGIREKQQ